MELKEALPILKFGTLNKNYPFFAPYILSDGSTLTTFNGDVYVKLDCPCPFEGMVNFFVLSGIINAISDEEYSLTQEDKKLIVKAGKSKSTLSIINMDFPEVEEPETECVVMEETVYDSIVKASLFLGDKQLENIYISESCICGASHEAVYYSDKGFPFEKPLGISRNNLKLLSPNMSLGEEEGNIVLEFDEGFMLITSHLVDSFPIDKIEKMIDETLVGYKSVLNAAPILDSSKYLLPVLHGEKAQKITFVNMPDKGKIAMSTISTINGKSVYEFDSGCDERFIFTMDANQIKKLDFGYQMCYNPAYKNRMLFKSEDSIIIIQGESK